MLIIYLILLFIAPQLWVEPFVGLRVDLFLYPAWVFVLALKGKSQSIFKFDQIDWIILGFIGWVTISALLNDVNSQTSKLIADYFKWFFLMRLIYVSVEDEQGVAKAVNWLLAIVFVLVIEGISHKLSPDGIGWAGQPLGWVSISVIKAGGSGRTQWINIFDGPGVFCVVYTLILPFFIVYLTRAKGLFRKLFYLILITLTLIAIWFSGSRGGFLATLAILSGFMFVKNAERLNLSLKKILMIAGFGLIALTLAPSHLTQIRDKERSAQHRIDMWMQGLEMVRENPLFGIGRGNYHHYTGSLIAHNSAIEIMGETGMPGLVLWIGIYFWMFKMLYARFKSIEGPESENDLSIALALMLLGYLVSSFFVTLEYETQYMMFALVHAYIPRELLTKNKITGKDWFRIFLLAVGFYVLIRLVTSLYY